MRNLHLNNATSGTTFTRTVQPSPEQDTITTPAQPPHTSSSSSNNSSFFLFLSRPVEDGEGCHALAGVRKLGLDDPSPVCPDAHCNFGDVGPRRRNTAPFPGGSAARQALVLRRCHAGLADRVAMANAAALAVSAELSCFPGGQGRRAWRCDRGLGRSPRRQ